MTPEAAHALVQRLALDTPGMIELGEAVACAARVDPALLRAARQAFLPEGDAGIEADLWFSPMVQLRSPEGFVLHAAAAEQLRSSLAQRDPARYEAAWELVQQMHGHLAPALRLEEELTYCLHSNAEGTQGRIRELLQRAIAALATGGRSGLARWAARALPRLPLNVRALDEAQLLESGARMQLGRTLGGGGRTQAGGIPAGLQSLFQAGSGRVPVHLALYPEQGLLGIGVDPDRGNTQVIELPETEPLVLEVTAEPETTGSQPPAPLRVELHPGETRWVRVGEPGEAVPGIRLRTLLGESFRLRRRPLVFIAHAHKDSDWVSRLLAHLDFASSALDLDIWSDRKIGPGSEWKSEIESVLRRADFAIILVSADLLASDFISKVEFPVLRSRAEEGQVRILPLLIRPTRWTEIEWLARWQALPADPSTLSELPTPEQEEAMAEVGRMLADTFGLKRKQETAPPGPEGTDPATLAELIHHLRNPQPDAALGPDSRDRDAVRALQQTLTAVGFQLPPDGVFGPASAQALAGYARTLGIESDGRQLDLGLAEAMVRNLQGRFSELLSGMTRFQGDLELRDTSAGSSKKLYVYGESRSVRFTRQKDGLFTLGTQRPEQLWRGLMELVLEYGHSPDQVRVATAVAAVQGNFDAVRIDRRGGPSFGTLQWAALAPGGGSPLTDLLAALWQRDPGFFELFFEKPGLGLLGAKDPDRTYDLTLRGEILDARELTREPSAVELAFRLWRGAQEMPMQALQLEQVITQWERLAGDAAYRPAKLPITDLFTSELAVATLLDHYVTAPKSLQDAMARLAIDTGTPDPWDWGDAEESRLLANYRELRRESGPGQVWESHDKRLEAFADEGLLQRARNSFAASRRSSEAMEKSAF